MLKGLRAAPADRFAERWSRHWPADLVGHVASHRRMHLDPLFAKPKTHQRRPAVGATANTGGLFRDKASALQRRVRRTVF
jgi:hypothetical protein